MSVAKSAEAFRTISEAAKELDVPQHVLRHWEEVFGQVRPMRRAGGRRYYRPLDIDLLRGIRTLLYDQRFTTKGVQKIFKDEGVKYVSELGRRAAAGEVTDVRPVLDDEDAAKSADGKAPSEKVKENGDGVLELMPAAVVQPPGVLNPAMRKNLTTLLRRLETVQNALDQAILALEAINPEDDER
ncbi:MerR family transcriptional regulator [Hyphococcus formosus]|uniref:MerR family transcriptional regulator n=1 Tax=Hyphococcus formosus TaxID=3143534 RepID=UPI00398B4DEF